MRDFNDNWHICNNPPIAHIDAILNISNNAQTTNPNALPGCFLVSEAILNEVIYQRLVKSATEKQRVH